MRAFSIIAIIFSTLLSACATQKVDTTRPDSISKTIEDNYKSRVGKKYWVKPSQQHEFNAIWKIGNTEPFSTTVRVSGPFTITDFKWINGSPIYYGDRKVSSIPEVLVIDASRFNESEFLTESPTEQKQAETILQKGQGKFEDETAAKATQAKAREVTFLARARERAGKTFYAYFPNKTCMTSPYGIRASTDIVSQVFFKDKEPRKVRVIEFFYSQQWPNHFYKLEMETGEIGYIGAGNFESAWIDPDSDWSLTDRCWSDKSPDELYAYVTQRRASQRAKDTAKAPGIVRGMDTGDFCRAYGMALRGESNKEIGDPEDIVKLFKTEAKRRKLAIRDPKPDSRRIERGMSQCQMYVEWGFPNDTNSSTGSWGHHTQHVYGRIYIYTENGRVTSWQD